MIIGPPLKFHGTRDILSCQVPTIIISPYITPGATDATDHNLYGLLGTMQDVLGYPRLNRAVDQTTLRPGLGF